MIDVRNLPLVVDNFERTSLEDDRFILKGHCINCVIIPVKNEVLFTLWAPVGAVLERATVETEQDVIKAIKKFELPPRFKR